MEFKERNREIWKKSCQSIILGAVGIGNFFGWIILKILFLNKKEG